MPLLEIDGLTRSYYGVHALRGVTMSVQAGRITGLIGPNGAGKTTLFNCISGLVPPDSGSIRFNGQVITRWRPDRVTGAGLVRSFQIARGFPRLTVLENLLLYGPTNPANASCPPLLRAAPPAAAKPSCASAPADRATPEPDAGCCKTAPRNCPAVRKNCSRSAVR